MAVYRSVIGVLLVLQSFHSSLDLQHEIANKIRRGNLVPRSSLLDKEST